MNSLTETLVVALEQTRQRIEGLKKEFKEAAGLEGAQENLEYFQMAKDRPGSLDDYTAR